MDLDERLLSLPFDHFERYSLTSEIVELLRPHDDAPVRVLDVGGHNSSLKHFLPNDRVTLADPKEPPLYTYRPGVPFRHDAYVRALGGLLPFADNAFDVVTAHETLDHVPPTARAEFVRDLLRVSRGHVVVSGPMDHPSVVAAERRVAEFWRQSQPSQRQPFLDRAEFGLPDAQRIESVLAEAGAPFIRIPNGNLLVWLSMMCWEAYVQSLPNPEQVHELMDRVFNAEFAARDFGGTCYRTTYVIAVADSAAEGLASLERAFADRAAMRPPLDDPGEIDTMVDGLGRHAQELGRQIQGLRLAVAQGDAALAEAEKTVLRLDRRLAAKDREMRAKNQEIEWIHQVAAEERSRLDEELARIRASASYRVTHGLGRRARRWFPGGTLRGRFLGGLRRLAYRIISRRERQRSQLQARPDAAEVPENLWSVPHVSEKSYRRWIDQYEPPPEVLEDQRHLCKKLPYRPMLSIVMPVWRPDPTHLRDAIDSVMGQTYDRWELCIADGGSSGDAAEILRELGRTDERIRVTRLERNLGISGNTNAAIDAARGDFVAFLDQSDTLAAHALFGVAVALNRDPGTDMLYSDWDILSEDGASRVNPFFTPEWSPDLLLSTNYVVHLNVIRRRLVEEVGGLRPELDGAQDWDLVLRISEKTERIARLPGVLYHWRADATSAVMSLDSKPAAEIAQRRAVQDHLDGLGVAAVVTRDEGGQIAVRFEAANQPTVSIIIPTRHNRGLLERCLDGIQRSSYEHREVLIVETAGRTADRESWYENLQSRYPCRVVWWEGDFNYSAVNNLAAREAAGEILVFLNDDTEPLDETWLDHIVGWLQRDAIGVVGAQLLADDGTIQHGGVVVGLQGFAEHLFRGLLPGEWTLLGSTSWCRNASAVTGACLAIRKELFDEVGGWDERFLLTGSDVELCLRVRSRGWRVVCVPSVRLRHHEGATRGGSVPRGDYFMSWWHYQALVYGGDPYFNPSLSYASPIPQLVRRDDPSSLAVIADVIGRELEPGKPVSESKHATAMARACRVSPEQIESVAAGNRGAAAEGSVRSVNWFIPDFENPHYGGIHTIFRFADGFRRRHGVRNRFVVIGTGPEEYIRSGLEVTFPALADSEIYLAPRGSDERLAMVPGADAAVATLWVTAYALARWPAARRRFYFVQDFEPMFYPAGALQALAEETYRMGLLGIVNTAPLREIYESYGGRATSFTPCVDTDVFHPRGRRERRADDPFQVFLYGRPGHPRNSFELAAEALWKLKEEFKDRVRIVTAGSWWRSEDIWAELWMEQLGMLRYEETADLYRACDAGLVLSVSKHPTYIPMQLMACGSLVVANENEANRWLLHGEENCLISRPTVDDLYGTLKRGLLDEELRKRLTARATVDIGEGHSDWETEIDRVFSFLSAPGV